eukprot:755113-Hanusia_phi.AAC.2
MISEQSRRNQGLVKQRQNTHLSDEDEDECRVMMEQAKKLVEEQPTEQAAQEDAITTQSSLYFIPFVDVVDVRECMPEHIVGFMEKFNFPSHPKRLRHQIIRLLEDESVFKQVSHFFTTLLWISMKCGHDLHERSSSNESKTRLPMLLHRKGTRVSFQSKSQGWTAGELQGFSSRGYEIKLLNSTKLTQSQNFEFPSDRIVALQGEDGGRREGRDCIPRKIDSGRQGRDGEVKLLRLDRALSLRSGFMKLENEELAPWLALLLRLLADPRVRGVDTFELHDVDSETGEGHNAREAIASCLHV